MGRIVPVVVWLLSAYSPSPAAPAVNVVLLTIDTFRPDRLSAYGHNRLTSPVFDSLAADGVLFEQAISSSSWTSPGLLSVLTGQWAPAHGVDVRGKSISDGTPTLATELRKAGYVVPDILYLSSIPNLSNLGLTRSYAERDTHLPNGDDVLFEALEAYRDSTFFLYYHYRNLHLPFNPSESYRKSYLPDGYDRGFARQRVDVVRSNVTIPLGSVRFAPEDSAWVLGLYDAQVREMDDTLMRRLVATLRRLGIYDRTLVIVTADHGEELLEHGFIGHPSTSFKGAAYDELLRIPLTMTCPSLIPRGMRVEMQVQNVDIFPTVLDLLGLPVPDTVDGRSLKPLLEGGAMEEVPAYTETTPGGYQATPAMMKTRIRAVRTSTWKLIHTHGPDEDRYELFDLVADPGERTNLADRQPDRVAIMRADLHQWALAAQPQRQPPRKATQAVHDGPLTVTVPTMGDTLHYQDDAMTVEARWTGVSGALYEVEYRVGEGAYHLEGKMAATGPSSLHGPFTVEMWNMLALYNPFFFRVTVPGTGLASAWVAFHVAPSGEDAALPRLAWASASFAAGEVKFLVTGLALGALHAGRAARVVPLAAALWGVLVVALVSALLAPVFRRVGRARAVAWGIVIGYTLFIYATLGAMPRIWGTLLRYTNGRIDYGGGIAVAIGAVVVVGLLVRRQAGWQTYLLLIPLCFSYIYLLLALNTSPAERFHLAEYGLLSLALYHALRIDRGVAAACLIGWGLATAAGAIDETIQWALPNRVFEWKDIGLNALSSGLGVAIVAVVLRAGSTDDRAA